jgi:CBS domain-containing protein
MDIELLEIQDFLAAHAPFDQLPPETLQQLPKSLTIRYLRRGQTFPPAKVEPALYLVRQGAIELRNPQGILIEKLAEGDLYTAACEQATDAIRLNGVTSEDSLLYSLSCASFQELCQHNSAFGAYFYASLRQRLQRVLNSLQQPPEPQSTLMELEVGQIQSREPVTASPDMRIIDAAQLMTNERLSSLLLVENDKLCGILTDHDLRGRCIAKAVDTTQPVRSIMTTQLHTISSHTQVADALLLMNQHNVHHLPLVDDARLVGIISSTDLIRQQGSNPIQLVRRIHDAQDLEALVSASQLLPGLQQQLVNAHTSCYRIGQIISSIGDALTQRLIALAHQQLGEAPVAYTWLAAGSLARQEMHMISDQDNALLLSDDYDATAHASYFEKLAQFVCDGLAACGIPYCPGEIMASNPTWRQPLATWRKYFDDWVKVPDAKKVMLACNFFDLRALAGDETLLQQLFPAAVDMAKNNQIFLAHLAANATRHNIPLGFFRQFVLVSDSEHRDQLDLKLGGVMPITELARLFALTAGVVKVNTYERLQAASEKNALSPAGAANLRDALEVVNTIRLRHQVQLHTQGLPTDNFIDPQALSQLERYSLKDAFAIIRDMHAMLAQRYQTERFFT